MKRHKLCLLSLIGSMFFSFCTVLGAAYAPFGTEFGEISPSGTLGYLPYFLVLAVFFYTVLFRILNRDYTLRTQTSSSRLASLFQKHPFLFSFLLILIAWIPYTLVYYPGNATVDAMNEINMAMGYKAMTNKHPVLDTLIYGALYSLGSRVSDNFSVFLIVLVQSVLLSAAFSLCICRVLQLTGRIGFAGVALLYFGLNPTWGFYGKQLLKIHHTVLFLSSFPSVSST